MPPAAPTHIRLQITCAAPPPATYNGQPTEFGLQDKQQILHPGTPLTRRRAALRLRGGRESRIPRPARRILAARSCMARPARASCTWAGDNWAARGSSASKSPLASIELGA